MAFPRPTALPWMVGRTSQASIWPEPYRRWCTLPPAVGFKSSSSFDFEASRSSKLVSLASSTCNLKNKSVLVPLKAPPCALIICQANLGSSFQIWLSFLESKLFQLARLWIDLYSYRILRSFMIRYASMSRRSLISCEKRGRGYRKMKKKKVAGRRDKKEDEKERKEEEEAA
ncbi:hypothetical protein M9H77_30772 [Catharanthus roseus]|uniref:Uncharacterized protein n=1 Tax=Catharanthus roseus TaxID=4058 RepID=A0ACC0A023_CATRO|nr:hypothetical protein M9H77_30772 [Catharanthus roseus]